MTSGKYFAVGLKALDDYVRYSRLRPHRFIRIKYLRVPATAYLDKVRTVTRLKPLVMESGYGAKSLKEAVIIPEDELRRISKGLKKSDEDELAQGPSEK